MSYQLPDRSVRRRVCYLLKDKTRGECGGSRRRGRGQVVKYRLNKIGGIEEVLNKIGWCRLLRRLIHLLLLMIYVLPQEKRCLLLKVMF